MCREVYEQHADSIAWKLSQASSQQQDILRLGCSMPNNSVLLIFSFFCCANTRVVEKLRAISDDSRLGYISFITDILNNWPSDEVKAFFHLVVCTSGERFEYHAGFIDFQHRFNGPSEYTVMPIELL